MSQGLTASALISNLIQQWWIEYFIIQSTATPSSQGAPES